MNPLVEAKVRATYGGVNGGTDPANPLNEPTSAKSMSHEANSSTTIVLEQCHSSLGPNWTNIMSLFAGGGLGKQGMD